MAKPKTPARSGTKSAAQPVMLREAEETLAHIKALWRELFKNPFAEAEEYGLTGPQVSVIAYLVRQGPTTVTELSRALDMTHSTASGIVDRLQARGLVGRSEDPEDRRRTVIAVTETVTQYVGELELGPSGRVAAALARASERQRRAIRHGLRTLRELLDGARQ